MKIEAGKFYKTRDGQKFGPVRRGEGAAAPGVQRQVAEVRTEPTDIPRGSLELRQWQAERERRSSRPKIKPPQEPTPALWPKVLKESKR